ncbi:hypothetical protein Aple_084090 [Acrocarpospora pleiomorpha]|uniref:Uncharacterized protein n=1 Tax=Acrocarpospora pleiomorpha TaxID=90975 RepID=A0A5M3XX16_9ACTN|nr:hypothetical protein [Acrocarpospora pleiomorpha]GES25510.1 hypothetical protein Aple_084090 [Acrocarpospora pleiomorpha]
MVGQMDEDVGVDCGQSSHVALQLDEFGRLGGLHLPRHGQQIDTEIGGDLV